MLTPQTHESTLQPNIEVTNGSPALAEKKDRLEMWSKLNAPRTVGSATQSVTVEAGTDGPVGTGSGFGGGIFKSSNGMISAMEQQISTAATQDIGDLFEYRIKQPVTIHKNQSALVPILQARVDAEKVTLWSSRQPRPLRALWLTNSSGLTLD